MFSTLDLAFTSKAFKNSETKQIDIANNISSKSMLRPLKRGERVVCVWRTVGAGIASRLVDNGLP
ncbi:hypothetical protein H1P_1200017 [Hyella patelloides LEGE 07179]|uniref:Uncharacterized protein n=1 Tax=Hyella patelloides LEGE 07179 TaxID=945734 RepID=A0A563VK47_9CYAN|nr:hypothetical protein H1P_1200017 [Hyella patelloides LEGE 07179]